MELKEILEHIGLTKNESSVFLKLLETGETTASHLAKEGRMHRRIVYDAMSRLVEKGLISFMDKDSQRYYRAVKPAKIMEFINRKIGTLSDIKQEIKKTLPKLEEQWELRKSNENAALFIGKEGIKTLYSDELKVGKTIHVICTIIDRTEEMLGHFLTSYTKERIKKKIKIKLIASKTDKRFLKKYKLLETKFVQDEFVSPASITIYGNKVGITLWSEMPMTILVESKEIASSFMNYFNLMWKIAKK